MSEVVEATRETFHDLITQDGWVLVDIWSPHCAPCLALAGHIEYLARNHADLNVVKLEAPKARRICIDLRVMGLPTLLLFFEGEEVSRISAPRLTNDQINEWLYGHYRVAQEVL